MSIYHAVAIRLRGGNRARRAHRRYSLQLVNGIQDGITLMSLAAWEAALRADVPVVKGDKRNILRLGRHCGALGHKRKTQLK